MLYLDKKCRSALHPKIFMLYDLTPDDEMLDYWMATVADEDLTEACFLDMVIVNKESIVAGTDKTKIFRD